jgi:hypothetical protein
MQKLKNVNFFTLSYRNEQCEEFHIKIMFLQKEEAQENTILGKHIEA